MLPLASSARTIDTGVDRILKRLDLLLVAILEDDEVGGAHVYVSARRDP